MIKNRLSLKHLLLEEQKKNDELRRELEELRRQIKVSNEDWELGKKSPRDLAIKWMCVATNVKDYQADERIFLFGFIDRLLALDNANNVKNEGCC